ncbi:hypothetical protein [Niabella beijingensis]|uniref:hypothetical protein n=1 Tax=Niabella beijingensis TaxID=2872700 RepID=UPI0023E44A45|nr:hypothetical protein [Niabella beijingensis]
MSTGKKIGHFLLVMLSLAILGSILTTITDYMLCNMKGWEACRKENVFQRLGFYSGYYFAFSFISLFFAIILLLSVLQFQYHLRILYIILIGLILGVIFAWLTQGRIYSLYIQPEKKLRYIFVVAACMVAFPFINIGIWKLFNKTQSVAGK